MSQGLTRDKAIQASIKHCIENDVLSEFLKTHYEEVGNMLNLQYDQEAEFRAIREEAREEARKEARLETAKKLLSKSMSVEDILEITNLSLETIEKLRNEL